jgi:hypothetical protein
VCGLHDPGALALRCEQGGPRVHPCRWSSSSEPMCPTATSLLTTWESTIAPGARRDHRHRRRTPRHRLVCIA